MAQITLNEGLAWLKTLKKRHEELITLRDGNAHRERRFYGASADKEIVKEPVYDVKALDKSVIDCGPTGLSRGRDHGRGRRVDPSPRARAKEVLDSSVRRQTGPPRRRDRSRSCTKAFRAQPSPSRA